MSAGEVGRALSACPGAAGDICTTSAHTSWSPAFGGPPTTTTTAGRARALLQKPQPSKQSRACHTSTLLHPLCPLPGMPLLRDSCHTSYPPVTSVRSLFSPKCSAGKRIVPLLPHPVSGTCCAPSSVALHTELSILSAATPPHTHPMTSHRARNKPPALPTLPLANLLALPGNR